MGFWGHQAEKGCASRHTSDFEFRLKFPSLKNAPIFIAIQKSQNTSGKRLSAVKPPPFERKMQHAAHPSDSLHSLVVIEIMKAAKILKLIWPALVLSSLHQIVNWMAPKSDREGTKAYCKALVGARTANEEAPSF